MKNERRHSNYKPREHPDEELHHFRRLDSHSGLITDIERYLTFQDVEGLHVVGVPVKWDAFPLTGLLIDEAEGSSSQLPCGKKVCGGLTHPSQLTLSGLVEVCAGCIRHVPSPLVDEAVPRHYRLVRLAMSVRSSRDWAMRAPGFRSARRVSHKVVSENVQDVRGSVRQTG